MRLQGGGWRSGRAQRASLPFGALSAIALVVAAHLWWGEGDHAEPAPLDAQTRLESLRSERVEAAGAATGGADAARAYPAGRSPGGPSEVPPPVEESASRIAGAPVQPLATLIERAGVIEAGSTLEGALAALYIHGEAARGVIDAYRTLRDPRKLRPGTRLLARFDEDSPLDAAALREVVISNAQGADAVTVSRLPSEGRSGKGEAKARLLEDALALTGDADASLRFRAELGGVPGEIVRRVLRCGMRGSLAVSLTRCGHGDALIGMLAQVLEERLDLERDVQVGDELRVVFEELVAAGETVRVTGLLAVDYRGAAGRHTALRFDGEASHGYFTPDGKGFGAFFLREPVPGARFTSGFGMRMHPILLQMRPHLGIDLAASAGTPVRAVAEGVVVAVGRDHVAGRYIKLRHARGYGSDYLHLSSIDRSVRAGQQVRRGQVIGGVGSSGRSTAPHLHLGIRHKGAHVDPMSVRDDEGPSVDSRDRKLFDRAAAELLSLIEKIDRRSGDAS